MVLHSLGFAKIVLLADDIAEVIIDQGVVMDLSMVNRYHDFLLSHLQAPFSLLINKINEYSYDFNAQMKIANIPQIKAMAIVTYTRQSEFTTQLLAETTYRQIVWNIQMFPQRDMALKWLYSQQLNVSVTANMTQAN
ncbi:hypothetical protein [Paraglaciecola hydrolytica]|uniref:STAS/SEC14 domain-containing protein n=1 Tax=Paraglaciecola hydrolytica TaxID=1799789 RepID=A0A135ZZ48_9ALTE|nr:hypothetical protein [Paraglaciecola hydrolytica]KXI28251.1 hypothetical protein AX660_17900 [Paraglaciecola hydrolytica]